MAGLKKADSPLNIKLEPKVPQQILEGSRGLCFILPHCCWYTQSQVFSYLLGSRRRYLKAMGLGFSLMSWLLELFCDC